MDSVEYCQFTQMKLWNDDDMRTMFYVFGEYSSKGSIELDVSLVISFHDIIKNLI